MPTSKQALQEALFEWLFRVGPKHGIAATGTFRPDRKITRDKVDETLRMFARMLDREIFGNRDGRGASRRVGFVPIVEGHERFGPELHWHGVIEVPAGYTEVDFIALCKRIWGSLNLSGDQLRFEPVSDMGGWLRYITKLRTKENVMDALVLNAMYLPD